MGTPAQVPQDAQGHKLEMVDLEGALETVMEGSSQASAASAADSAPAADVCVQSSVTSTALMTHALFTVSQLEASFSVAGLQ